MLIQSEFELPIIDSHMAKDPMLRNPSSKSAINQAGLIYDWFEGCVPQRA